MALKLAQRTGDPRLAEHARLAIETLSCGRVFRGSRWSSLTREERAAIGDQPGVVTIAVEEGDPVLPPRVSPEELSSHLARVGADRLVGHRSAGFSFEVIGPDDRRDTLSEEEVRRLRIDHWERLWRHLAGVRTPIMGWRGWADGAVYVFLVGDDPETRRTWAEAWSALEARPELIIGPAAALGLLAATGGAGFGMAVVEPGTPRREWLPQVNRWPAKARGGSPLDRLRCEIRLQRTGNLLWSRSGTPRTKEDLLEAAAEQVARRVPIRSKDRIDAFPAHLACWLLSTGYGDLRPLRTGFIARAVFGVRSSECRDVVVAAGKTVRDHVEAARAVIARYAVKT